MKETDARMTACCNGSVAGYENDGTFWCRGSDCMAWRWTLELSENAPTGRLPARVQQSTTHGYCGLAGKP